MSNANQPSPSRYFKNHISMMMAGVMLAAIVSICAFLYLLELEPNISVRTPPPPSPNAFDDYQRAATLLTNERVIEMARRSGTPGVLAPPLSTQENVLRNNIPALRAVRLGLTHAYASPRNRSFTEPVVFPAFGRRVARLLALERDVYVSHSEWSAAMQTSLNGIQMGSKMGCGGGVEAMLVGAAVEVIARDRGDHIVDHLSFSQTKAALNRIHEINKSRVSLAQILQQEEADSQARLMGLFRLPQWRLQLTSSLKSTPSDTTRLADALTSKRRVMSDYTKYMDMMVADARAGRPLDALAPSGLFREFLVADLRDGQFQFNKNFTQDQFLELQLALRAYRLQLGSYPQTLQALSPTFEPMIPNDPFAPGKPLRYQRQGDGYFLYSVGPDGVDDGGKAVNDSTGDSERSRRTVRNNSKGDVVAGVNF